jgi:hypothetical protein
MDKEEQREKLFEAMLAVAIEEDFENRIKQLPSEEELAKTHPLTPELEARMEKVIKKYRRKMKIPVMTHIAGKIAVGILFLFVISFGVLMSVEASRVHVLNTIMEYKKEFIRFSFSNDNTDIQESPYRLLYIPNGFEEKETVQAGTGFSTKYKNSQGIEIIFDQVPLQESGAFSVDNENNDYSEIKIGGNTGYLLEGKTESDRTIIIWRNNTYHFKLISCINKNELLKMAESVAENR